MKSIRCSILTITIILFFLSTIGFATTAQITPRKNSTVKPKALVDSDSVQAPVKKARIVVETVAYMPAPLKEGSNISMYITFKNKGLAKSYINAKFNILCQVLSGGGPNHDKCAVASTEMPFGKEIPPGATHSVSLLGASPAKAGKYKVIISIPGDKRGRPFSLILEVAPKFKLQKAPANKVE